MKLHVNFYRAVSAMLLLALVACGGGGGSGSAGGGGGGNGGGAPTAYTIGGTVSGLNDGALVTLQDNSGDSLKLTSTSNGTFTLPTALSTGSAYTVTVSVAQQPSGESCTVANGSGTIGTANVGNISVTCTGAGYDLAAGEWTSVSGGIYNGSSLSYTSGVYGAGIYGTQGVAAAGNAPGARDSAVSWSDTAGNLWLFGGWERYGAHNDLWMFSPITGLWTWVGGSNTANAVGVYGTRGVAAAGNVPGARKGAVSWKDSAGNFWLFGGIGYDASGGYATLNDLWKFSPSTGWWTWISGSNTAGAAGCYSTQCSAAAGNVPAARYGSVSWTDTAGNLWLFGGEYTPYGVDDLNDLWKFSPSTGLWTWVGGSNATEAVGVYGTLGVAAAGNVPGARENAVSWTDSSGNFWLFGGMGWYSNGNDGDLNDLWKFSPSTGLWTWVSGSNSVNQNTVYGTRGVAAVGNVPGARDGSVSWIDSAGNLWLFGGGGDGFASNNDLWKFTPGVNLWTWIEGSNITNTANVSSNFGIQGIPAPDNAPSIRTHAVSWIDSAGNLWLFGGYYYDSNGSGGSFNELWAYKP